MENEKEHVLIYGTSKSMDETVFQWREGLSIRVFLLAELFHDVSDMLMIIDDSIIKLECFILGLTSTEVKHILLNFH
jgi:hypothetical protein